MASLIITVVYFAVLIFVLAAFWKMFKKAGKPGWGAIIPIYNMILLLQIAKRPLWWVLLLFIPVVSFVIAIVIYMDLADRFGKTTGFALGLIFLPFIFVPILGFGDAKYQD